MCTHYQPSYLPKLICRYAFRATFWKKKIDFFSYWFSDQSLFIFLKKNPYFTLNEALDSTQKKTLCSAVLTILI